MVMEPPSLPEEDDPSGVTGEDEQSDTASDSLADSGDGLSVDVLRELFRRLVLWRTIYESDGVEIITLPDGHTEVSIHDVEYLLSLTEILPLRHRQAIYLCLVWNYSEEEAAEAIRIDISNPVAQYATAGLRQLLSAVRLGLAPSLRQMHRRQAVKAHRSENAQPEGRIDLGPGVLMEYYQFPFSVPDATSEEEDRGQLPTAS